MSERHDPPPPVDEAVFSGRVSGSGPSPAAVALTVAVAGVLVIGAVAGREAGIVPVASQPLEAREHSAPVHGRVPPVGMPVSLVSLDASASGALLFVHGEVFTLDADVVDIIVRDGSGAKIGERRVELPDGSTAFRLGAADRFQATFSFESGAPAISGWITAIALDAAGNWVATQRAPMPNPRELSRRYLESSG